LQTHNKTDMRRLVVMGGAYGNLPALKACMEHVRSTGCDETAFLGDATGFCGHSDETIDLIRRNVPILVAGNHEQQAAAGSDACGCNYAPAGVEKTGTVYPFIKYAV